ncbi:FAD-dependent oxidoreductase [Arthrobacter wenxiniae]|nr:FAD-dependent oxidoreductase [Arthrobacter wenxiniae]
MMPLERPGPQVARAHMPHIVVIGFGPVAARLVDGLLPAVQSGQLGVTVVGDELHPAYNRVLVADLGVGRTTVDAITLAATAELEAAGVVLDLGRCVRRVDRARQLVHLSDGRAVHYDKLVFATGSRPVVPKLHGLNPDPNVPLRLPAGVTTLRDLKDAATLHRAVLGGRRVVVLGGGILGVEAALAAAEEGARVTVVHHGAHTLGRSIDADAGQVLAGALQARGIAVAAHARSTAVVLDAAPAGDVPPEASFTALKLDGGGTVPGDLLVLSCGVRPRTEVAAGSGLRTARGILVDHSLQAHHDPQVFAIGDCAEIRCLDAGCRECAGSAGPQGLIGPGWRQAEWLAGFLVRPAEPAPPLAAEQAPVMLLKARGVDVAAAGNVAAGPFDPLPLDNPAGGPGAVAGAPAPLRVSVWADPEHGKYVKMATRDGVLEGFVSVGMPRAAAELVLLFERGAELPADRSALLGLDSAGLPAPNDPSRTVCRCAGVDQRTIAAAVAEGCGTVAEVSARTRAGTGCGGCHGEVRALIEQHFQGAPTPA